MRKTIVSMMIASMVAALVLAAGTSGAATRCERLPNLGLLCVTTPPEGIEVFRAGDHSYQRVHGVGIECFNGHYYLQYQLGSEDTYRPVPLFDLGTDCPLFS